MMLDFDDLVKEIERLPKPKALVVWADLAENNEEKDNKLTIAFVNKEGKPLAARQMTIEECYTVLQSIETGMLTAWPQALQTQNALFNMPVKGGAN